MRRDGGINEKGRRNKLQGTGEYMRRDGGKNYKGRGNK